MQHNSTSKRSSNSWLVCKHTLSLSHYSNPATSCLEMGLIVGLEDSCSFSC